MKSLAEQFDQDGFVVARGLLTSQEVEDYRAILQKLSGLTDKDFDEKDPGWTTADITRFPDLWPLIFNERLVATIREIFGPSARYTQHSDLHVHHGNVSWHRDSAHRRFGVGPDWDESVEKYQVARVAIYLQKYSESGSSLGVIPGSHRRESSFTNLEVKAWNFTSQVIKKPAYKIPMLTVKPVWIETEPGDCIIFDTRLLHSPTAICGPKYAIFLSYGAANQHARNHRTYYLSERPELGYQEYPPELAERLRQVGLYLENAGA